MLQRRTQQFTTADEMQSQWEMSSEPDAGPQQSPIPGGGGTLEVSLGPCWQLPRGSHTEQDKETLSSAERQHDGCSDWVETHGWKPLG